MATIDRPMVAPVDVTVVDISPQGFQMESDFPFEVGGEVTLNLPRKFSVVATVRWHEGHRFGCEFRVPLSPGQEEAANGSTGVFELRLAAERR